MQRATVLIMIVLAGSVVASPPASACAVYVTREPSSKERQNDARRVIHQAAAVIDGEVVEASDGKGRRALVYAHRVLKGPQKQWFEVGERDSCDVALMEVGERLRLVLVGGPEIYFSSDRTNARAEDSVLKSDRRKDWPYRRGIPQGTKR